MGFEELAETTIGVGKFTVAEFDGLRMVVPVALALASTRVTATADAPMLSTTVAVTVKVPAVWKVWVALADCTTVPSPESMVVRAIEPSGANEPAALAFTVRSRGHGTL